MARKTKTNGNSDAPVAEATPDVGSVLDVVIKDAATGREIRFGDLPVKSQARLVTKGANEILTDSGAFSKEQVAKFTEEGSLDAKKAEARDKRWNSLLTGEFSVGVRGPRVDESTRVYNECLAESFKAYWQAQRTAGAKVPAWADLKADQLKGLLTRWAAHTGKDGRTMGDVAREQADRRIAESKATREAVSADFDLTV